jgi:hypothetical protein
MFENPILFSSLVSIIITLVFFFINKDRDKKDQDPGKNTKYLVVFGIVFIVSLIGKICYGSKVIDNIEKRVDKMLGSSSSIVNEGNSLETTVMPSTSGETPPF